MEQILYEDSRQQQGKHNRKNVWWKSHGVHVERKKLDFGDYMVDGSNVSVDTKRNLAEVAMDCGRDHDRFAREMERARDAGYRLVILVEVGGNYRSVDDVVRWTNDVCKRCWEYKRGACKPSRDQCGKYRRRPMTGKTLAKIMRGMERDYGCVFDFVHPLMAGKRVCEWLGVRYDGDNRL